MADNTKKKKTPNIFTLLISKFLKLSVIMDLFVSRTDVVLYMSC